jgi:hypothetical protein
MSSTCGNCGLSLSDGDAFCGNCGQAVTADRSAAAGTDPAAANPVPVAPAPAPAPVPVAPVVPAPAVPVTAETVTAEPVPAGPASRKWPWAGAADGASGSDGAGAGDGGAAAAGEPADPADAYADRKLSSADLVGEPTFDPLRSSRFRWQVVRRFLLYAFAAILVELVVLFFGLIISLIGGVALAALAQVVTVLVLIGLFVSFLLMPVPAMLAYGSKLVSYRGSSAQRAFECIEEALSRHQTPADSFGARPLTLPGEGRRQYLELRRGFFAGYISCFEHGRDLYLSWTFWIYMSPLRLALLRFSRTIENLRGRGNDLYQTLRYESVRATVSAIQICAEEGISEAIREADGTGYSLSGGLAVPVS